MLEMGESRNDAKGTIMSDTVSRTPVLYLSHGAPPLADDRTWTSELAGIGSRLGKPTAVLIVSAHWEAAPLTLAATQTVPLLYDFWGFPERYYQVEYAAPGAPNSPTRSASYCTPPPLRCTTTRTAGSTTGRMCR